jgi:hypothetical protein
MKNFLRKIGRFFRSRGFLKFVLWTVTLIILFYVEEDWRGARMWAATKAKWEARGESFDYNRLVPPPIPDDQNLAAIPLFKMEPDPEDKGYLGPLNLRRALRQNLPSNAQTLPSVGGGSKATFPDFEKIYRGIADAYENNFHAPPVTSDPLIQLETLYPLIVDLRTASATRPLCRFALDYTSQPPYARSLGLVTLPLTAAKILSLHAVLALHEHQPDLALADVKTLVKLAFGTAQEPELISGLVACAMNAMAGQVVATGLALHAWNDAQLAGIEEALRPLDSLADYQLAMHGELLLFSLPTLDYLKTFRPDIGLFFTFSDPPRPPPIYARAAAFVLWPNGWLDQNKCHVTDALLTGIAFTNPGLHRVFPQQGDDGVNQVRRSARTWDGIAPWKIYSSIALAPVLDATVTFAQNQVRLDQCRIACALERYRLAHGVYPSSLDDLAPSFISEVPRDVINGEPYRYRLLPDGTYLLYSVGWNQTDEGGLVVTSLPPSADPDDSAQKHGDWVWPVLKTGP